MTYRFKPIDPGRDISDSSGPIMIDFSNYSDTFDINHIEINDLVSPGNHFKLDIPNSTLSANLTDDEIRLANAKSDNIPDSYILSFYRLIAGGSQENINVADGFPTAIIDVLTNVTDSVNGWYTDPSGTLVKWGMLGVNFVASATDYTITLPVETGIPVFATAPLVLPFLRTGESAASLSLKSSTTTAFIVNTDLSGASTFSVAYIALGT